MIKNFAILILNKLFFKICYPTLLATSIRFIRLLGPDHKLKKWYEQRKTFNDLKSIRTEYNKPCILIFCPSLGEYESIKYLVKLLKVDFTIHLSFFSDSGYINMLNREEEYDQMSYTPIDEKRKIEKYLSIINPSKIILASSFDWPNLLLTLYKLNKAYFFIDFKHKSQIWYRRIFFKMLAPYYLKSSGIFTSDQSTYEILQKSGFKKSFLTEHLRISSILQDQHIAEIPPKILEFKGNNQMIILGSIHLEDLKTIGQSLKIISEKYKILVVPHDLKKESVIELLSELPNFLLYNTQDSIDIRRTSNIMVVNCMGLLKHLYAIADMAFIGGGFGQGIHSILEPAIYNIPILSGPNHKDFPEAAKLIKSKQLKAIKSGPQFLSIVNKEMSSPCSYDFSATFNVKKLYTDVTQIVGNIKSA